MSEYMEVFVKVHVTSQEEADRLAEASFSGLLSDLIEMWLKHGSLLMGGTAPIQAATAPAKPVRSDPDIPLAMVATEVGVLKPAQTETVPEPRKPRGLSGRNRMRRM